MNKYQQKINDAYRKHLEKLHEELLKKIEEKN